MLFDDFALYTSFTADDRNGSELTHISEVFDGDTDEMEYRPFQYKATPVTRPQLMQALNGQGILFTEWNEEHQFNYFRYWIGRYSEDSFEDDDGGGSAAEIIMALKTVVKRDEYDLENIREDLVLTEPLNHNEDPEESMILNEEEFIGFGWNTKQQHLFRMICCEVIDIIPFYKQWIDLLAECQSISDMIPMNDAPCCHLPCPSLDRLLIVSRFYSRWMTQNFGDHLTPRNKVCWEFWNFDQNGGCSSIVGS